MSSKLTAGPTAGPKAEHSRFSGPKSDELIARGDHSINYVSKAVFFIGRALDPIFQYAVLAHGVGTPLLHRLGLRTLPAGLPAQTGITAIDALQLSPYRLVLLGMVVSASVKQNIWITTISNDHIAVKSAVIIATFNGLMSTLGTYTFLATASSASTSSTFPQPALLVGSALFTTGILLELVAEVQRLLFKRDPNNKGKVYTGGLFSLARHINYGGYTLWRAGYGLACGGWILGGLMAAFFFYQFQSASIPEIDTYCSNRYGEEWDKYKTQTKWKLLPFIY